MLQNDDVPIGTESLCRYCGVPIIRVLCSFDNKPMWVHNIPNKAAHSPTPLTQDGKVIGYNATNKPGS